MLKQPMFFVRQYYFRGESTNSIDKRIPLLISHYTHHEIDRERALRHMRLLKKDSYRFLYDSTNPIHAEKLKIAAGQPDGFRIFTNVLARKWEASPSLKKKIFDHLKENNPGLELPTQNLRISLQDLYGKLYLFLRWKSTSMEILLDEIEKNTCHVL